MARSSLTKAEALHSTGQPDDPAGPTVAGGDGHVGDAVTGDATTRSAIPEVVRYRRDDHRRLAVSMRAELSASEAAVLALLEAQMDDGALADLAGPDRCLVTVHLADPKGWRDVVETALSAFLQTYALPADPATFLPSHSFWSVLRQTEVDRILSQTGDRWHAVTGAFTASRTVAAILDNGHDPLDDLADLRLRIDGFDADAVATGLYHHFAVQAGPFQPMPDEGEEGGDNRDEHAGPRSAGRIPIDDPLYQQAKGCAERLATIGLSALTPDLLDLACTKAGRMEVAEAILARGLWSASRRGTSAGGREGTVQNLALDELPGYEAVRDWAQALADDIHSFAAGTLAWQDVDPGALLTGPPGTGKTLLAAAIAKSAGARFIATSFADWQAMGDGHLGSTLQGIRHAFEEARSQSPTVLFIDEIDSVPKRDSSRRHDSYWRAIVNALLEELDGTGDREGLTVLAACNDADHLDPALVRSGRLDRVVLIDLPTAQDLCEIVRHYLPMVGEAEVMQIGHALAGRTTGADIARMAREARQLARRDRRPVTSRDVLQVAMPPDNRSPALRRRIAVHEAGHAVALLSMGLCPSIVSILPGPNGSGGQVRINSIGSGEGLLQDAEAAVIVALAGRAAEEIILGEASAGAGGGDLSDLAQATQRLAHLESQMGLGRSLVHQQQADVRDIERRLQRLYGEAQMIVLRYQAAVRRIADKLVAKRILNNADFKDILHKQEVCANAAHIIKI
ncbi:AAA family ATPase [Aureimonas phyllosphaerae]|uniref:AAA family ATPase n=1 Tax=Aureimonas phyllosphaerae TaxID=1166078 RepID=UPI003A5C083F